MTVAMYMSPHEDTENPETPFLPVMMADTLITFRGNNGPRITPATLTAENYMADLNCELGRKLHLFGEAAVAFAGSGKYIEWCYGDVVQHLPDWLLEERPMFQLAKHANKYWKEKGPGSLEALGACKVPTGINTCYLKEIVELQSIPPFGKCTAIGSGHADLLSQAQALAPAITQMKEAPISERVLGFVNSLNGRRICEEMFMGQNPPGDWGGYVEHAMFDRPSGSWIRGPSTIHLIALLLPAAPKVRCYAQLGRAIGYEPGDESGGGALTMAITKGGAVVGSWKLARESRELLVGVEAFEEWREWKPQAFALTLFAPRAGQDPIFLTRTNNPGELDLLDYHLGPDGFRFTLPRDFIRKMAVEAATYLGESITDDDCPNLDAFNMAPATGN